MVTLSGSTRTAGLAAALALLLSGCFGGSGAGSGGSGGGGNPIAGATSAVGGLVRGTAQAQEPVLDQLPELGRCPRARVQPQTEVIRRDDGSKDPQKLNWQATITRVARECTRSGDGVSMRIGVAGRVIKGPAGAPERIELPVRIAVREGGTVTQSAVHKVAVTLSGPSQDWAHVEEAVVVTAPNNSEILVGFDG